MKTEFATFSLDEFVRQAATTSRPLEVIARVEEDSGYFVIRLDREPSDIAYRLPKSSVQITGLAEGIGEPSSGPWMRLLIERDAPCVKLTAAQAAAFFSDVVGFASVPATLQASIALVANGEGHITFGGATWPCLGNPTTQYTRDLTVKGEIDVDKFRRKYSNEFQVWMDFAILIMGQKGIYIHEGPPTLAENGNRPSAGCIHVGPPHAQEFYDFVSGRTRILISYPW